jgi:hypothetical protein
MFRIFAIVCLIVSNGFLLAMSFEGTLYGDFLQQYKDRIALLISEGKIDSSLGTPQIYEHLNPTLRPFEAKKYLEYARLPEKELVERFERDFLELSDNVSPIELHILLTGLALRKAEKLADKLVLRKVGRLEIELLMTKMSVKKEFFTTIKEEISRGVAGLKSISDFLRDSAQLSEEEKGEYWDAVIRPINNILRFLINPGNPDSVSRDDTIRNPGEIFEDVRNRFFAVGSEELMELFFRRLEKEKQQPELSVKWGFILNANKEDIDIVSRLLEVFNAGFDKLTEWFSRIEIVKGENTFSPPTNDYPLPTVHIEFDAYDLQKEGLALVGGYYCYFQSLTTNVGIQQKTIFGAAFHELDHALHFWECRDNGSAKRDSLNMMYRDASIYSRMIGLPRWGNDEEFLTISGLSYDKSVWFIDPISCAAFCRSEFAPNNNVRCFHIRPDDDTINVDTLEVDIPLETWISDIKKLYDFIYLHVLEGVL